MTATAVTRTTLFAPPIRRATRDILPIALAVAPFGTVVGVTLDQAGLTGPAGLAGTALLYAGSAQLATLSVLIGGGSAIGAVVAGAVVNARLLLYSAQLGHRFRGQPGWFRWIAPLTTVDQTFALASEARDLSRADFRRYWITIGLVLGAGWLAAVTAGMAVGSVLPAHSPMDVAVPATLLSLLLPALTDARMRRVAATAACVAAAAYVLPAGLGIVAGIAAALLVAGPGREDAS